MAAKAGSRKLLLIGWSGADWRVIQPLLEAGHMPNLDQLIRHGAMGNLHSLNPIDAAITWTTIATGRYPDQHGVLGPVTGEQAGNGIRPVESGDLSAPPIWQVVNDLGYSAAAVGWPVSHPATVFDDLVISDAFAEARAEDFAAWPLREHSISDPQLQETFSDLRLHPTEITSDLVLRFVPNGARIDQETDERLPFLVASLARAASIQGAGTWIAAHRQWQLLMVHYDLIERLCAVFMQYRPPRMPHVSESDYEIYRDVVDAAYQFMDLLLGPYLQFIDTETQIMLVSGHGFLNDQLRRQPVINSLQDPVARHYREFGIFVSSGPGIRKDELIFGATALDIAPTVLAQLGLPVSRELEGRILDQMLTGRPDNTRVESYPSQSFQFGIPREPDQDWRNGRVTELAALGYLPEMLADPGQARERIRIQQLGNLAKVWVLRQDHRRALVVLEELLSIDPEHRESWLSVAQCHYALGDTGKCRATLDDLVKSGLRGAVVDYLYGQLCIKEGNAAAAQDYLRQAEQAGIGGRRLLERIGRTHLEAQQWLEAEQAFRKAIDIDPDFALAYQGLGIALARQAMHTEAIDHLLRSIGLLYHQPEAHVHLGLSLAATGRLNQAAQAVQNAIALQPDLPRAKDILTKIQKSLAENLARSSNTRQGRQTRVTG